MELRSGRRLRSSQQQQQQPRPGGGGVDRISALPDDLLLLTLAHLPCASAAVRTGVLSSRWRGLWACLRQIVFSDVPFSSLEAALSSVDYPAVSILEIHVPYECMPNPFPDQAGVDSLLRAAARLAPEEFVFALPGHLHSPCVDVDLSCFHSTTSIELDSCLLLLRVPTGVDFPALETLSLSGNVPDLDPLLSRCPRLRTLQLRSIVHDTGDLSVSSASLLELIVDRSNKRTSRVNIVTPVLKQLTMSFIASDVVIYLLAPMMEKVRWNCWYSTYDKASIVFGIWRLEQVTLQMAERQGRLPSLVICAHANSHVFSSKEKDTFAQEIEKHMIAEFSILELYLTRNGHAFRALVFHLLGMIQIYGSVQKLKIFLKGSMLKEECPFHCLCEPSNCRSQTISLSALEEVEINGFEGYDHEIDFLKLIFKCAPVLKKMTVKLSQEVSTGNAGCAKIYNIFESYSSVQSNVDHNYGQEKLSVDTILILIFGGFMVPIDKTILSHADQLHYLVSGLDGCAS